MDLVCTSMPLDVACAQSDYLGFSWTSNVFTPRDAHQDVRIWTNVYEVLGTRNREQLELSLLLRIDQKKKQINDTPELKPNENPLRITAIT
jgi:hypothetical protein